MEIYAREFSVEFKADQSPLTEADRASHDCIVRHLRPIGIPVVSEEDEDAPYEARKSWPMHWLVDPLDGTKEFVKRNGDFTVNIALIVDGRPLMGVVLAPVTGELFVGAVGEGGWKGLKGERAKGLKGEDVFAGMERLGVKVQMGKIVRMVMSKSHLNPETLAFVERWKKEGVEVEAISRGSSMKLCLVAAGKADVYPRLGPTMEWDTAAAQAVVEAAGGRVIHFDAATHSAYEAQGPAAFFSASSLAYNKPNRLNPSFVVFCSK
jgi:3'(2'), 5'-bisphosphate nucleotidase